MNFSEHAVRATLPPNLGTIIFSTRTQRRHRTVGRITIQLQTYEALIIEGCNAAEATSNFVFVDPSDSHRAPQIAVTHRFGITQSIVSITVAGSSNMSELLGHEQGDRNQSD